MHNIMIDSWGEWEVFLGERAVVKFILVDSFLDLSAFYVLPPMYRFNLDVQ